MRGRMGYVFGRVAALCLLTCGCATQTVSDIDAEHPELRLTKDAVYMGETPVPVADIVTSLEEAEIPKDRAIRILLDRDMKDMRDGRALMALLARGGYTRAVLVTKEHGVSRTKSGKTYAEFEGAERRSDVDFYFYRDGVTFGRLVPLATADDALRCLKEQKVGRGQLIRLNYLAADKNNKDVARNLTLMEKNLRKAGYTNVCRLDSDRRLKKTKTEKEQSSVGVISPGSISVPREQGAPVLFSSGTSSTSSTPQSSAIRYKKAED